MVMSDHDARTQPFSARDDVAAGAPATRDDTGDHLGAAGTAPSPDRGSALRLGDGEDPLARFEDRGSRTKILVGTAVLTLVNLLLLVAVLAAVTGRGISDEVVVDGVPCVVVDDADESTLYCQR